MDVTPQGEMQYKQGAKEPTNYGREILSPGQRRHRI
ncbi:MAG: hypothetical protein RJA19_606 [Bacteroidota bacterium]